MARRALAVPIALAVGAAAVGGGLLLWGRESQPEDPFAFSCPEPEPSPPALAETSPAAGVNAHLLRDDLENATRCAILDRLAAGGVTWLRLDLRWSDVQPRDPGEEERFADSLDHNLLTRLGSILDAARARGVRVLVTLFGAPPWATGSLVESPLPPLDPTAYGRIAGHLAGRLRGRVDAWQIWNEPNEYIFFNADGEEFFSDVDAAAYVALLRSASEAIREADPRATVVLGGPSYNNIPWLELVYAEGAAGLFDVMSVQPYTLPSCRAPEFDDGSIYVLPAVAQVRALMVREGDGDLPVWFTEFGWSSHGNVPGTPEYRLGLTESAQGDYLVRTLRLLRDRHPYVEAAFWYRDRDVVVESDDPTEAVHLSAFGLLRPGLTPKPAYRALRAYLLDGALPERLDVPCP